MGPRLARHLRGNMVGYLALFVALGGTTYAAIKLPSNSVGTKQLKNGAVTGAKVAKNTLTAANINLSQLGTVPRATNAAHAATATSAGTATSATTATTAVTATNASQLGGQPPSAFQQRVTGTCSNGSAVSSISPSGGVSCQQTSVTQMMGGSSTASISPGTEYFAPVGLSPANATESNVWLQTSNLAGTAGNLSAETTTAAGGSVTVTLRVNGSATLVSCTIPLNGSNCSDSTDTAAIPAGAYVDMSVVSSGLTSARVTFGWTETS